MGTISFLTTEGHNCTLSNSPQGIHLLVIPLAPPFDDGMLDLFTLNLKYASAAELVKAIKESETYISRDGNTAISTKNSSCAITFDSRHHSDKSFTCHLHRDATSQFVSFIEGTLSGESKSIYAGVELTSAPPKIGRNELCPCGSFKKYKHCHLGKQFALPEPILPYTKIDDPCVKLAIQELQSHPRKANDSEFWHTLAIELGSAGYSQEALELFDHAFRLKANPMIQLNRAATLDSMGRSREALEIVRTLPEHIKRKAVIHANIAQSMGLHEEAIRLYERAIQEEPDFFLPYARILNSLRRTDSQFYEYWIERAIHAVPSSPWIAVTYCYFLLREGRIRELATADWIETLSSGFGRTDMIGRSEEDPKLILEAQLFRAAAIAMDTDFEVDLEKAVETLAAASANWTFCDPAKLLVFASANLGRPDLVERAYLNVCPHCREHGVGIPKNLDAVLTRAHLHAGDYETTIQCAERVLSTGYSDEGILWAYWWSLDEVGQTNQAVQIAERLYEINNSLPDLCYNLGYLCGKIGLFGRSKFYYSEELERNPKHPKAGENSIFVDLLEGNFEKAVASWERFKSDLLADPASYLTPAPLDEDGNVLEGKAVTLSEFVDAKQAKYEGLLQLAKSTLGSLTYTLDLITANNSTDPRLGSDTAIGKPSYSIQDILSSLSLHRPREDFDLSFQLRMQQRIDYSAVVAELRRTITRWDELPEPARRSLIEGENRWVLSHSVDYSPSIMTFAKAVEVTLKTRVFDEFRTKYLQDRDVEQELESARRDEKYDKVERFLMFLYKGHHLELGGMVLSLQLAGGKTAKRFPVFAQFADFLRGSGYGSLLSSDIQSKIDKLARDYRNPAVHASVHGRESAVKARELALGLLSLL